MVINMVLMKVKRVGESTLIQVNDEGLCRSTQWVVSLNTALSPSSCVVIQEEEYNHTLGSLTPLILVPHPVRTPRVAVVRSSGRAVARSAKWMNGFSRPAWDPAPSFEAVLEPRPDFHTDPPQIGDSLD